ncbi:MAG: polysaccharide pyruvyl transferase family protein [Firmicutes bacterium]|nr:polysaccharide pyruvyl transferase family protein [Dethiobacter sp.]MBS3888148.1 polysaccharide pyruvyl transferase family protein [Bacillota bacterium]MBS4055034.1 polysaccharide pyruvyl transferase family protein [Thermaerobacter sp.]
MTRTFIMAFIGAGNLGDEAILAGTLAAWRQAGVADPLVFSWQPEETARLHQVTSLPIEPGLGGLTSYARHLQRGDLVLLGGGSLLQDGERRIVPFWLSRALVARLCGCRVVFHAQGIGPLRSVSARLAVRYLVPLTAHLVTLRDEASMAFVRRARPRLVADPALLLPAGERHVVPRRVVVALRPSRYYLAEEEQLLQVLTRLKHALDIEYIFVPMHYPDDYALALRCAAHTGGQALAKLTLTELRTLLASAELVIAMRLHAAILAAGVLTPIVGLAYDPKILAFFSSLGLQTAVVPWGVHFSGDRFFDTVSEVYQGRTEYQALLQREVPLAKAKAAAAVSWALELAGRE